MNYFFCFRYNLWRVLQWQPSNLATEGIWPRKGARSWKRKHAGQVSLGPYGLSRRCILFIISIFYDSSGAFTLVFKAYSFICQVHGKLQRLRLLWSDGFKLVLVRQQGAPIRSHASWERVQHQLSWRFQHQALLGRSLECLSHEWGISISILIHLSHIALESCDCALVLASSFCCKLPTKGSEAMYFIVS